MVLVLTSGYKGETERKISNLNTVLEVFFGLKSLRIPPFFSAVFIEYINIAKKRNKIHISEKKSNLGIENSRQHAIIVIKKEVGGKHADTI